MSGIQRSIRSSRILGNIRPFAEADIPEMLNKIFSEFDKDGNHRFTKIEFPKVLKALINLIGGE